MASRLLIEPMLPEHIEKLAPVLLQAEVYEHIGGQVPTPDKFALGLQRALAGPPRSRLGEHWLNYIVLERKSGTVLGRLEATVHDGLAEVAFLFGPQHWGRGFATEGLRWLDDLLAGRPDCRSRWATTVPNNVRSQALLQKCGYRLVNGHSFPALVTYDPGDLVYQSAA